MPSLSKSLKSLARDAVQNGLHAVLTAGFALAAISAAPATAVAQTPAKPDPKKGEQIVSQVCVACHGADGNSVVPANPKLAGQHADYIYKQLSNFKVKQGAKAPERMSAVMGGFAGALSDDDMHNLAAYLSSQKLKPSGSKNKDTVLAGQKIYRAGIADKNVPACAGCHSPDGAGIPAQYPRIGGQFADYLEAQLVAFRQGTRTNSPQMAAIAARMSDAEIKAVADYAAGLR